MRGIPAAALAPSLLLLLAGLTGCGPMIAGIATIIAVESDDDGCAGRPAVTAKQLGSEGGSGCALPAALGDDEALQLLQARRSGRAEIIFTLKYGKADRCVPVSVEILDAEGRPLLGADGNPVAFRAAGGIDPDCARAGENRIVWDASAIKDPTIVQLRIVPKRGEDRSPPLLVYVDNRRATRLELSDPISSASGTELAGDIEIPFRVVAPRGVAGGDVRQVFVTYSFTEPSEEGDPAPSEPKLASIELPEGLPAVGEEGSVVWHSALDLPDSLVEEVEIEVFAVSYDIACAKISGISVDNSGLAIKDLSVSSIPAARSAGALAGLVVIEFSAFHERSVPVDLSVQVALSGLNGGQWIDATEAAGFREPGPLATSPEGVRHRFVWNSSRDLDRLRLQGYDVSRALPVSIRVAVTDPSTGKEAVATAEGPRNVLADSSVQTVAGGLPDGPLPAFQPDAIAVGERAEEDGVEIQAYYAADAAAGVVWRIAVPLESLAACGSKTGPSRCQGVAEARYEVFAGGGASGGDCGLWDPRSLSSGASLSAPSSLAYDPARGFLYIADSGCGRIFRVEAAEDPELRPIALIAGTGASGAGALELGEPKAIALSADGSRLYVADSLGGRILALSLSKGQVSRVDLVAESPRLEGATGLALSERAGVLYVSKAERSLVVGADLQTGEVFTAAGTGSQPAADEALREGPALSVTLCSPAGLSIVPEHGEEMLYIAEREAGVVRAAKILSNGTLGRISSAVGSSRPGGAFCGGAGSRCGAPDTERCVALGALPLGSASHAVADPEGRLLIADPACGRIFVAPFEASASARYVCRLEPARARGALDAPGPAITAPLGSPSGVLVRKDGALWLSDASLRRVFALDRETGILETVAGRAPRSDDLVSCGKKKRVRRAAGQSVAAKEALLGAPGALAEDLSGNVYIADRDAHAVWVLRAKDGKLRPFAGRAVGSCSAPGFDASLNRKLRWASSGILAADVDLDSPSGLAVVTQGGTEYLYISDARHHRVIRVRLSDKLAVRIAGQGRAYSEEEARCGSAKFIDPRSVELGDGGVAAEAFLNEPGALAWDGGANLYIADTANHRIRRLDLSFEPPRIFTVAGTGWDGTRNFPPLCEPGIDPASEVSLADPPLALELPIGRPLALAARRNPSAPLAPASHLLFVDGVRARIWSLDLGTGRVEFRAGADGLEGFAGEGDDPSRARFRAPAGIAVDDADSLYVADSGNSRLRKFRLDFGDAPFGPDVTILDNGMRGTSSVGPWRLSAGKNPFGKDSLYIRHAAGSYTYSVPLPSPGLYEVFAWWTQYPSRSEAVTYAISAEDGEKRVVVSQRARGGQWNRLGEFRFGETAQIRIEARADGASYCADAVLLRPAR